MMRRPVNFQVPRGIRAHAPGYVYLFKMQEFFKIGRAKDVKQRIAAFKNLPVPVELVHAFPTNDCIAAESELHDYFCRERIGKTEWFFLQPEDVAMFKGITESFLY